ncbi:MAG: hypothetical protein V2I32_12740 [Desulforhopalus sp.]|jgi:hypothetical protein|nr:hypothetical protein [Desulforhopalus sp.]
MASVTVCLITSRGLSLFLWRKDTLIPAGSFVANDQGLAEFARAIQPLLANLFYLVADLSEEDFRVELLAHTRGKDRQELLSRKLLQFFRGTVYRSARFQGREKGGRRDDTMLFSALTNPQTIDYWVDFLLARKVQISGIISTPLLTEHLTASLELAKVPHLLLINIEQHSGLRQSYLQQGQLKFSRLVSLARQESLADILLAECRHTRQYLERQKLLPHDQLLQVHTCLADGMAEKILARLSPPPLLEFQFHEAGMISAELGIDPSHGERHGPTLLTLQQILRSRQPDNVYAPPAVLRYRRLKRIGTGLKSAAVMTLLIAFFLAGSLIYIGLNKRTAAGELNRQAAALENRYQELVANSPESPVPAKMMRRVVDAAQRIGNQTISPLPAMVMLSRTLDDFPDLQLAEFTWQLVADKTAAPEEIIDEASPAQDHYGDSDKISIPKILPWLVAGKTGVIAQIKGAVTPSGGYLHAQQRVTDFITRLESDHSLRVTPTALPTETAPEATVKTVLGDQAIEAQFSLKVEYPGRQ